MKLNLGCSDDLRGGDWMNVDIAPPSGYGPTGGHRGSMTGPQFQQADLSLPWPWEDSSVDEIYAADIFEHIGDCSHSERESCQKCWPEDARPGMRRHWSGRIHTMNEAWRVLKPGGLLTMICPDAAKGAGQWQDPQHVTPWTPNGLQYFCVDLKPPLKAWDRFRHAYGVIGAFRLRHIDHLRYEDVIGALDGSSVRCEVWKFTAIMQAVKDGQ
jgi:hypothetical protein